MIFKKYTLLVLVLIILSSFSIAEDYDFDNSISTINLDISSKVNIVHEKSNSVLKKLTADLQLKPNENFQQQILSSSMPPNNHETSDSLVFTWESVDEEQLEYYYKSKLKINNNMRIVKEKIPFPLKDVQKEVIQFTKPTNTINSDHELIINKASELIEGEDDLYIITIKLADWIKNNIKYDLNTLTAESVQNAVWVIENKKGVCDEITILFISMLRSLDIPAKYSYGLAYSNLPEYEDFVSHAWAEVYFPEYGWVPFDVTYGQFGYIDSSHIKLGESFDTNKSSVSFSWTGYGVNIEAEKLDLKANIDNIVNNNLDLLELNIESEKQDIGPTSYNIIKVNVKNKKDYYVATELRLSKPKELKSDFEKKTIILKPGEEKTYGFIVKAPDTIKSRTIYKYPITVSTSRNTSDSTSFQSSEDDPIFSRQQIEEMLLELEEQEQKQYSASVDLNCKIKEEVIYFEDPAYIDCAIKNLGNVLLRDLELCFSEDCKKFDLGITQEIDKQFIFEHNEKAGNKEKTITLRNNDVFKKQDIRYVLLDNPELEIGIIEAPNAVNLDDTFAINIVVAKNSFSDPRNIKILLSSDYLQRENTIDIAKTDINMNFNNVLAKELSAGANTININIEYQDNQGKTYKENKQITIILDNTTAWDRFKLFWVHLLRLY